MTTRVHQPQMEFKEEVATAWGEMLTDIPKENTTNKLPLLFFWLHIFLLVSIPVHLLCFPARETFPYNSTHYICFVYVRSQRPTRAKGQRPRTQLADGKLYKTHQGIQK
uniref:Uncharacterized protein n=1 Tax=Romanomermis culicivorax TaxID=13658 RepID=A0A915I6R7_ROMCU